MAHAAPKDDVLAAVNARYEAMVSQDMALYDRVVADDLVEYSPVGKTTDKSFQIDQMGPGGTDQMLTYELKPVIHVYGNTATASGLAKVSAISNGKKISFEERFLDVWIYRDGRWQLLARQGGFAK
jgi:ketosteroid isomerase-like protein